jgi:hypothetical protein
VRSVAVPFALMCLCDIGATVPQIPLREGLIRTTDYFEKLLKDENIRPFIAQDQGL